MQVSSRKQIQHFPNRLMKMKWTIILCLLILFGCLIDLCPTMRKVSATTRAQTEKTVHIEILFTLANNLNYLLYQHLIGTETLVIWKVWNCGCRHNVKLHQSLILRKIVDKWRWCDTIMIVMQSEVSKSSNFEATIEIEDYNLKLWSYYMDTYICNGQWFFPVDV